MAKLPIRADLDLNQNEIQNTVVQNLASAPSNPKAGQFYFNTVDKTLYVYADSSWTDALSQGIIYTEGSGIDIEGTAISVDTSVIAQLSDIPTNNNQLTNGAGYITGITGSDVTTALGYTPYNSTNPSGYQANIIETVKVNGTTQTVTNKAVDIAVPTSAGDVSALPSSTKYGASLVFSVDSSTYVLTATLKDQDGNTLGTAQTVDLPIESVVVNGSYDSTNKKIILTLQGGSTIEFSVADLISGLQSEITSSNKLDADLVDDSTSSNKFVTASNKLTWNGKQDAISDLSTIRSGASKGATATQKLTATNGALTAVSGVCTWTVSNTLASADISVQIFEASSNVQIMAEVLATASTIIIKMNSTNNIAADSYRMVAIG